MKKWLLVIAIILMIVAAGVGVATLAEMLMEFNTTLFFAVQILCAVAGAILVGRLLSAIVIAALDSMFK